MPRYIKHSRRSFSKRIETMTRKKRERAYSILSLPLPPPPIQKFVIQRLDVRDGEIDSGRPGPGGWKTFLGGCFA